MKKVSCFIRKNTTELRKKLRDIGFCGNYSPYDKYVVLFWSKIKNKISYSTEHNEYCVDKTCKGYINCGENEDLFLAIAALNLPTDNHKWFITDKGFVKCGVNWFNSRQEGYTYFRIATIEELIKHFK